MVYAIMSIGVLGFIVWSQFVMAPEYREIFGQNLAVCWDSLMLIGTLYSKNSIYFNSYTQSAGNRYLNVYKLYSTSTSETICKKSFNFDKFYYVQKIKLGDTKIDSNWLEWFIGFVEGDGAILTFNDRLRLVITQKEKKILDQIRDDLGFGQVKSFKSSKNGNEFHRFIVDDKKNILILIHLFNGNLVLKHRLLQLKSWIEYFNLKILNKQDLIIFKNQLVIPTLKDSWISGFTDAEGCFNLKLASGNASVTGYRVIPRFCLDQKNEDIVLNYIRDSFGFGRVNLRSGTNNVFRYNINSVKGLQPLIHYFNIYSLKTKKLDSFLNWLKVYNMIVNKEHLTHEGLSKIREIKKIININNSFTHKIGSSSPR